MSGMWMQAGTATRPEIDAFVTDCPFVIWPVGSTEQHGPHLPVATDTMIAEAVALETAKRSRGLVLPGLNLGYAWVWKGVSASLTLEFDTYRLVMRDVVASLEDWGVKAVYIMSGHGANGQAIKHAVRDTIHGKHDVQVLYGMYSGLGTMMAEAESTTWAGDLHAEEIETSLILAIAPELVHMDRAAADYPPVPPDYGQSATSMGHVMRSGVFGDPTKATAEKGRRWLNVAATESAALWTEFLIRNNLLSTGA